MAVEIKHVTNYRARYIWDNKLTRHEFQLMEFAFKFSFPQCTIRPSSGLRGCVIKTIDNTHCFDSHECCEWFCQFLVSVDIHGPITPPTKSDLFMDQARLWSIKSLMVMAVLGWILPVLPGTPFFLLAWWMGWRPSKSDQSVAAETQCEPS